MQAGKDSLRTDDQSVDALKHEFSDDKSDGFIPSADFKLQHKYNVWAMMKHQARTNQPVDLQESYHVANKIIADFSTVGEFWHVQSHLRRPSVMPIGTFLHFFIDGVKPLWEDDACKDGGRWTIKLPKSHTAKYWEELLLGLVGEQFDLVESGEVLGVVLSLKFSNDMISIWHKTACNPEIVKNIRVCTENILGNNAFKGSHAFNKPGAQGADLATCVAEGTIKIEHENFKEILARDQNPKPFNSGFERAGFRGRGGNFRGGRGGGPLRAQAHQEEKKEDDDFQTVTDPKK